MTDKLVDSTRLARYDGKIKDYISNQHFVSSASVTGSGNAVTAVSASNGVLTITKGESFQKTVTYSTTDLTAGTSALTTGEIYLVYE